MKVYILEFHIPYEGFEIIGVFSSREAAEILIPIEKDGYNTYKITEWGVK